MELLFRHPPFASLASAILPFFKRGVAVALSPKPNYRSIATPPRPPVHPCPLHDQGMAAFRGAGAAPPSRDRAGASPYRILVRDPLVLPASIGIYGA